MSQKTAASALLGLLLAVQSPLSALAAAPGWFNWRGPFQNGTSLETGLPDQVDPAHPLWVVDFPGQSTPVIANGKLYIMGYLGEGENLQEGVIAYDAETGKELWRALFNDFLSDTVYLRYGTSSPAIDPKTGNVYIQGTQGILAGFTPDGKQLWQHSLMEEYGRLTFPNSRTASPIIEGDLVITRGITANWGANGPAADRFYAFDTTTGELVWASTPGAQPKDNSFSHPVISWLDGKRVLYSATGDGAVVCLNAISGEPLWRVPLTKAGINSAVLIHNNDKVISIYGTPYEPGQLVALKIPHVDLTPGGKSEKVLIVKGKAWPADSRIASSPGDIPGEVASDSDWGSAIKNLIGSDGKFKPGAVSVVTQLSGRKLNGPPLILGDTNLITPGLKFADGTVAYATNLPAGPAVMLGSTVKLWEADISTSTSSPILVGDRVYVVSEKGDLYCVEANTGKVLWKLKLGIEERNSCPIFADGKLYVPMLDDPAAKSEGSGETGTKGALYIIKPTDTEGQILAHVALDGRCFGTPTAFNGKVYIQTTRHVYCFGKAGNNPGLSEESMAEAAPTPGAMKELQIIPAEILMRPGEKKSFKVRGLDAKGGVVKQSVPPASVKWASFVPPTAKVKSAMHGAFDTNGVLTAAMDKDNAPSAGAFMAQSDGVKGFMRGRVLPTPPYRQDFESFTLTETNTAENAAFAYPPLPWIGARFKFEIRELDGNKVLAKTIDNPFFQRATVFIGHADAKNYTLEADIMSDGNKRVMSDVGLVNQRYYIVMKGASKKLEVTSTQELFRKSVDFAAAPNVWYHLKTRVDTAGDGSGVIRAKIWKKGDAEPAEWTIEVALKNANQNGSPGLFSMAPQKRVYIDNISVTPNQ